MGTPEAVSILIRWRVLACSVLSAVLVASAGWADASSPSGLAGKMETTRLPASPYETDESFEWHVSFDTRTPGASDVVIVDLALIPFDAGPTLIGVDGGDGAMFVSVLFEEGQTPQGIPYDPSSWNDVWIELNFTDDTYRVRIGDADAGQLPFSLATDTIQAFRVNRVLTSSPGMGWIDTVSVRWVRSAGTVDLVSETFDDGETFNLGQGRLSAAIPGGAGGGVDLAVVAMSVVLAVAGTGLLLIYFRRRKSP